MLEAWFFEVLADRPAWAAGVDSQRVGVVWVETPSGGSASVLGSSACFSAVAGRLFEAGWVLPRVFGRVWGRALFDAQGLDWLGVFPVTWAYLRLVQVRVFGRVACASLQWSGAFHSDEPPLRGPCFSPCFPSALLVLLGLAWALLWPVLTRETGV